VGILVTGCVERDRFEVVQDSLMRVVIPYIDNADED